MAAAVPEQPLLPESRWTDLDGPVHYLDFGGPADGPLLVCVHGLGGSALNWAAVGPTLAQTCRVVAPDLAGFGHTVGGGSRSTTVQANQRLLHRFLVEVAGTPAILVGNSMGGLISIRQAAQRHDTTAGLVLVDPALPPEPRALPDPRVMTVFAAFMVPVVGRRLVSRPRDEASAEKAAHDLMRLCCADPARVPDEVVELHRELAGQRLDYPDVDSELLTAAQSLFWVLADRRRFAAMQRAIDVPVLLLHGDRDRLINIGAARAAARANPHWQFEVAEGVGHVPQLEDPEWTIEKILGWLAAHPDAADVAAQARPSVRFRR
ncbi:alpha/beta hydrolase [Fodinibacter luteus]|uniref:alpha/beta fold hydrolase n=1 Tax=Fodinibacter luteus TaxID=552064 RepID=UPI0031EF22C2